MQASSGTGQLPSGKLLSLILFWIFGGTYLSGKGLKPRGVLLNRDKSLVLEANRIRGLAFSGLISVGNLKKGHDHFFSCLG
jgi:hypothetical protein